MVIADNLGKIPHPIPKSNDNVEFKPVFDIIEPKKPYIISFTEWIRLKGRRRIAFDIYTTVGVKTVDTCPNNHTYFITNISLSWDDQVNTASTYLGVSTPSGTGSELFSYQRVNGKDNRTDHTFNPPLVLNQGESITLYGPSTGQVRCHILGYWVSNSLIKEN